MPALSRTAFLGSLGAMASLRAVPAFAAGNERVRVAVGGEHVLIFLPWDLAKILGYFEAEGLDVTLTYTKGGTEAARGLSAGVVDFSGNAFDHAMGAQAEGRTLVMIANFMHEVGYSLLIRSQDHKRFQSIVDLRGKRVGVTSLGAGTHVIGAYMAHKVGIERDDITFVGVGSGPTMQAALAGRQIDAAFAIEPFITETIHSGQAIAIADLAVPKQMEAATGFSEYTYTGVLARPETIARNPELCQKIVRAIVRAQRFIVTHKPSLIAERLTDEYRGGVSTSDYAAALSHVRSTFTESGVMSAVGIDAVVRANAYFRDVPPEMFHAEKLYNNEFVEAARRTLRRHR